LSQKRGRGFANERKGTRALKLSILFDNTSHCSFSTIYYDCVSLPNCNTIATMTDHHPYPDIIGNNNHNISWLEQEHASTADRALFVKYTNYDATIPPTEIHEDNKVPIWALIGLIVILVFIFRGLCMGPPAQVSPMVVVVVNQDEGPPKPKKQREDPEIRRKRILRAFDVNQVTLVRIDTDTSIKNKKQQQNVRNLTQKTCLFVCRLSPQTISDLATTTNTKDPIPPWP
jgi:hypothetical protein